MRVFMLGWEFPPFISGGLGTACSGLTKALSRQRVEIVFVLPKAIGTDHSSHVRLLSPQAPRAAAGARDAHSVASTYQVDDAFAATQRGGSDMQRVTFKAVPSRITNPYQSFRPEEERARRASATPVETGRAASRVGGAMHVAVAGPNAAPYEGDLIAESQRYAALCVDLARGEQFDVIHAHDWLTF